MLSFEGIQMLNNSTGINDTFEQRAYQNFTITILLFNVW
jgi:hypothetical protein